MSYKYLGASHTGKSVTDFSRHHIGPPNRSWLSMKASICNEKVSHMSEKQVHVHALKFVPLNN